MRALRVVMTLMSAGMLMGATPVPPAPTMWRLDCGEIQITDLNDYSDTYQYTDRGKTLTSSCYLVRSGEQYLLWDSGLPAAMAGASTEENRMKLSVRRTVREQLTDLNVDLAEISFIGLSHYHFDHTGQAQEFPNATLLIGSRDWEAVNARADRAASLRNWTDGGGKVVAAAGDHDVFGDGQVIVLATPGHTPGHRSLLVRLRTRGPILLSGDLYHFSENRRSRGVPGFNSSRAETLASMDRFERVASNLGATVILQHEPRDIEKLPRFPAVAR